VVITDPSDKFTFSAAAEGAAAVRGRQPGILDEEDLTRDRWRPVSLAF
jgi:hypothetical protein